MARTFGAYAFPDQQWAQRLAALAAVGLLTFANLRGVSKTARVALALLILTLATLLLFLVVTAPSADAPASASAHGGPLGVLQSAGLLFFTFAGYARIATLAEEVRRPEVLGRAILTALAVAVTLYLAIGLCLLGVLGNDLATSSMPLADAARAAGAAWAEPVVRIGAAAASLGALLALVAGVGRTALAMARHHDLPGWLAHVEPRHQVPHHAQMLVGVLVAALVLVADLRAAIGFSSFVVLLYYAVANLSALRQPVAQRRWPRALQVLGLVGCLVLVATLPWESVVAGIAVLSVGVVGRLVARRRPR